MEFLVLIKYFDDNELDIIESGLKMDLMTMMKKEFKGDE